MGRKRQGRGSKWTEEDLAEVLAHLDCHLEGKGKHTIGGMNSKEADARIESILAHLEEKMANKYSARQIRQKLFETYEMGDPDNAEWNFQSVFQLGSCEMRCLDEGMKALISTKLVIFECMTDGRQLRVASQVVESPRKDQQGLTTCSNARHSRKRDRRSANSATPARLTESRAGTPFQSSRKRTRTNAQHLLVTSPIPYPNSYRTTESRSTIPETPPTSQSPLLPPEPTEPVRSHQRTQRVEVRIAKRRIEDAPKPALVGQQEVKISEEQLSISMEEHNDLLAECFALRKELDLSRDEIDVLKRERKERNALMLETHGNPNELMKVLKQKQHRISDLKAQQAVHSFLGPFFSLRTGELRDMDLPLVQRKYINMRSQLVHVSMINNFQDLPQGKRRAELLAASPELNALRGQLRSDPGTDAATDPIADVSAQHLIQSLIAVAVRDWVFYDKFTSVVTMETPLLNAYRHHLSNLCNPEMMRSLDFASHRQAFDQESFKEVILPRMASKLECRLIDTLRPILQSHSERNGGRGKVDMDNLRQRLNGIFSDALELKILAMVSKDMFECIWPSLDTGFDSEVMETECERFRLDEAESDISKRVRLVLVPGLRLWDYDRRMVDYFGFKREHDLCTGGRRTLRKAVVLV